MATSMSAILKINAQTSGDGQLREMDRLLRRIGPGAESSVVGVARLGRVMGDIGTVAGGIGLAGLGSSLISFSGNAVQAADETVLVGRRISGLADQMGETARITQFAAEAADKFTIAQLDASRSVADIYARLRPMGISLQDIETTFTGVNNVARIAGLTALDTQEGFRQLAQAMGAGKLQGDELRSIMERMPQVGVAIVDVFNDIAKSKGLEQITKQRADILVKEVKDGEKRQTSVLRDQISERIRLAEDETGSMLKEIKKRYDAQRKAMGDNFDDMADEESNRRDDKTAAEEKAIEDRYEAERKFMSRRLEDARKELSNDESLSEEQKVAYERQLEDRRDVLLEHIQRRQDAELEGVRETAEKEAKASQRALRDKREREETALQDRQDAEEKILKDSLEKRKKDLQTNLDDQIAKNKAANEEMIADILAKVKITQGDLKRLGAEGLITPEIMVEAMKKLEDMKIPDATPMMEFNKAMGDLSQEVGDNLLPMLTPLIKGLSSAVVAFGQMPESIQGAIVAVTGFGVALSGLQFLGVIRGVMGLTGALSGLGSLRIAATIAGWLGAFGPFVAGAQAALGGLTTWMTGTLLPTLAGVFSGPVGWIALAVAALSAAVIIWREPLIQFATWLWDWGEPIREFWVDLFGGIGMLAQKSFILVREAAAFYFRLVWETVNTFFLQPFIYLWENILKPVVTRFLTWYSETWTKTFNTVMTWLDKNIIQPLGKIWDEYVRTPIANFFIWYYETWIGNFNAVIAWLYENVIQPLGRIWDEYVRTPITNFFTWYYETWTGNFNAVITWLDENIIQPLGKIWDEKIRTPITGFFTWLSTTWNNGYKTVVGWLNENFVKPFNNVWTTLKKSPEDFTKDVKAYFFGLYDDIIKKYEEVQGFMSRIFRMSINFLVNGAIDKINNIVDLYNTIANTVNSKTNLSLPTLSRVARRVDEEETVAIKKMATGAYVNRRTLAWVGEGSNPREYVIPEDGMDQAAMAWQAGLRGNQLVAAWQSPGLAPGRSTTTAAQSPGGGPVTISLTHSGDVFQLPSGENLVRIDQVPSIIEAAVSAVRRRS